MNTRVCIVHWRSYTVTRSFRLTPAENEALVRKLDGRTLSSVVRALIDGAKIPPASKRQRRITKGDLHIIAMLAGAGNNLNQIARTIQLTKQGGTILGGILEIFRGLAAVACRVGAAIRGFAGALRGAREELQRGDRRVSGNAQDLAGTHGPVNGVNAAAYRVT